MGGSVTKPELVDDGERMIPEFHKGNIIYGEHLGRYLSAQNILKGKTVLDIASGSGYGTKLMAETAKKVIGVDIEQRAVDYAKQHYAGKNIEYIQGSGTKIPLQDGQVDAVVSMETIEHIEDQETFLKEVKRVMKTGGVLIVSTPNDRVYPKGNHFHVKEHNKQSLLKLLNGYFKHVDLYYQVVSVAASVLSEQHVANDESAGTWRIQKTYTAEPDKSIYYIAVCSDAKLLELDENTLLSQEFSHLKVQEGFNIVQQLNKIIELKIQEIDGLKLNNAQQQKRLTEVEAELTVIKSKKYWKLASKLTNHNQVKKGGKNV